MSLKDKAIKTLNDEKEIQIHKREMFEHRIPQILAKELDIEISKIRSEKLSDYGVYAIIDNINTTKLDDRPIFEIDGILIKVDSHHLENFDENYVLSYGYKCNTCNKLSLYKFYDSSWDERNGNALLNLGEILNKHSNQLCIDCEKKKTNKE